MHISDRQSTSVISRTMSSGMHERHSRKRPFMARNLNGEDDDDSDIEVIPAKQPKNREASIIKQSLISALSWMKSTTMFKSFISSALHALGYADEDSSDEFEEVEIVDVVSGRDNLDEHQENRSPSPLHEMSHYQKQPQRKESFSKQECWRSSLASFGQKNTFLTIGNQGGFVKVHFNGTQKPFSSAENRLSQISDGFMKHSLNHNKGQSKASDHGASYISSIQSPFAHSSQKKKQEGRVPESNYLKLLDRSQLIKDRSHIPLRRNETSDDVQIVKVVPPSDVLISRTKLVLQSKARPLVDFIANASSRQSSGANKFTTDAVIDHQEKQLYKVLLDSYFQDRNWVEPKPKYKDSQIQVDFVDIEKSSSDEVIDKYIDHYYPKRKNVIQTSLPKPRIPPAARPIFKQQSPEDDVLFFGERPLIIEDRPRKHVTVSATPESPFFSPEWIKKFTKNMEEETAECMRLVAEQHRHLDRHRKMIREKLEAEKMKEVFPELTPEMESMINKVLMLDCTDTTVLKKLGTGEVSRKDLESLSGRNWLNDEVINFYLAMIQERSEQPGFPSVYAFSTYFYSSCSKGYANVKRWTKKFNIFDYDMLLIPLHLGVHWCLGVVDFRRKFMGYYDSMGGVDQCMVHVKNFVMGESLKKFNKELDMSDWNIETVKGLPSQSNGYDCGMFVLKYAEYVSRDAPITFSQANMQYFRRLMVYEIITGKIIVNK